VRQARSGSPFSTQGTADLQLPDDLVFVDEVQVPGKRSKIRLWTLDEAR
jgi:hypothetical protein